MIKLFSNDKILFEIENLKSSVIIYNYIHDNREVLLWEEDFGLFLVDTTKNYEQVEKEFIDVYNNQDKLLLGMLRKEKIKNLF